MADIPVFGQGSVLLPSGDASFPAMAFEVDPDTGWFWGGTGKITATVDGTAHATFSVNGSIVGPITGTPRIVVTTAGTVTLPTYTFLGDNDTGAYRAAADVYSLVAGGVEGLRLTENVGVLLTQQVNAGLTADVGSAQGGTPLTSSVNQISTCATAGDSVTLPTAVAGHIVTIINNGAASCDVFPASGDNLGAGLNTAAALASGANITYRAYDDTNWFAVT